MPLTLWLTDRSRYSTGTGRCKMERYLKNHFGPTGYGIVRKAESLPLMTGNYMHKVLELLYRHLQEHDSFPTVEIIRGAINEALGKYEQRIDARGFRGLLQSESTDAIIQEQQYLIAGLTWAFVRHVLPWIHANYRIVQTELETIYVLDCTCGLGSGVVDALAHDAKECLGIGQMLKQDAIARKREGGTLAYFEAKTTGWGGDNWAPQWETRPQLAIGNLGIRERYGAEVTENFVVALYKGSRKTSQPKDPFEQAVTRQESPFCYGYRKLGSPPLATDEWLPSYEWVDELGKTRRAGRDYQKAGVWEIATSDWPTWVTSKAKDPSLSPTEVWVQSLPESVLEKQCYLIGPLNRQDQQIASLKQQIAGEEHRWQEITWQLYQCAIAIRDEAMRTQPHLPEYAAIWSHPSFQAQLHALVPASWECRRFGTKHECEFKPLCFKESGWEDPLGSGIYVPRRPHHQPELEAAIARGLLPEQGEEEQEDD